MKYWKTPLHRLSSLSTTSYPVGFLCCALDEGFYLSFVQILKTAPNYSAHMEMALAESAAETVLVSYSFGFTIQALPLICETLDLNLISFRDLFPQAGAGSRD